MQRLLVVVDAGNHRVLGWQPHPEMDRPADLVLGQADFGPSTELPCGPQRADLTRFSYGVDNDGARLAVADTANIRILLWDRLTRSDGPVAAAPDSVIGQPNFASNGENHWSGVTDGSLCWRCGISLSGDRLVRRGFGQQPDRRLGTGRAGATCVSESQDRSPTSSTRPAPRWRMSTSTGIDERTAGSSLDLMREYGDLESPSSAAP